jgi:hypothetical protein
VVVFMANRVDLTRDPFLCWSAFLANDRLLILKDEQPELSDDQCFCLSLTHLGKLGSLWLRFKKLNVAGKGKKKKKK